jgi:hypothetical protein
MLLWAVRFRAKQIDTLSAQVATLTLEARAVAELEAKCRNDLGTLQGDVNSAYVSRRHDLVFAISLGVMQAPDHGHRSHPL